jgi:SAM-dependent methyltransferase
MAKPILDVACGGKMFYFDKNNSLVHFNDLNPRKAELNVGREFVCNPDTHFDFTDLPFENETFYQVIFDPPHIKIIGDNAYRAIQYGRLSDNWEEVIRKGFAECWRVCKTNGTIIFKWSTQDIDVRSILNVIGQDPVFGTRRGKRKSVTTWFFVFFKVKEAQ